MTRVSDRTSVFVEMIQDSKFYSLHWFLQGVLNSAKTTVFVARITKNYLFIYTLCCACRLRRLHINYIAVSRI